MDGSESTAASGSRTGVWPDLLAFVLGLGAAWWAGWNTADLIWSLWLSSLVVGHAIIIWAIFGPGATIMRGAWHDRALLQQLPWWQVAMGGVVLLIAGLFSLIFFTLHFGGFHYIYAQFLKVLFPVNDQSNHGLAGLAVYEEVLRRYWIFLPMAFIAERAAFRIPPTPDTAVTPEAIARRKAAGFTGMLTPYKNVLRMHLLIFFFLFAHLVQLENFVVYAVIYATYFFPWRVLTRKRRPEGLADGPGPT